jgi:hypothetical protein
MLGYINILFIHRCFPFIMKFHNVWQPDINSQHASCPIKARRTSFVQLFLIQIYRRIYLLKVFYSWLRPQCWVEVVHHRYWFSVNDNNNIKNYIEPKDPKIICLLFVYNPIQKTSQSSGRTRGSVHWPNTNRGENINKLHCVGK